MLTFISGKQKPLVVHGKNILAHKSLSVFWRIANLAGDSLYNMMVYLSFKLLKLICNYLSLGCEDWWALNNSRVKLGICANWVLSRHFKIPFHSYLMSFLSFFLRWCIHVSESMPEKFEEQQIQVHGKKMPSWLRMFCTSQWEMFHVSNLFKDTIEQRCPCWRPRTSSVLEQKLE